VRFVHGADGIARQIARLTAGQAWRRTLPDRALFTGEPPASKSARRLLSSFGLETIERF
jgi:glutamate racemase